MMNPRRILYPFSGKTVGGSHHSTLAIIDALDRSKFEPVIVLHENGGPLANLLRAENRAYETLPLNFFAALHFIKKHRIDAVHLDNGSLRLYWFPAAKLCRVPYIHFQRTLVLRGHLEKRFSYALFDAAISNSKQTQHSIPKLPKHVLQAISYPVINLAYSPQDRAQNRDFCLHAAGLTAQKPLIGYVANMRDEKRPLTFIAAAKILKEHGIDAHYYMVGGVDGDEEQKLKNAVANANLTADFTFTGAVHDAQKYIGGFDLLITPAMREAFGRVLIEAMGLGTPVIAADAGGHKEIIDHGKNGFLVPVDDAAAFAQAAQNILQDPALRERIVSNGLATAAGKFSAARQIDAVTRIYKALLKI